MKLLNDIAIDDFLPGRVKLLLLGMLILGGCASIQPGKLTPPPLQIAGPAVQIEEVDVLAVSPAMEKFLQHYILKYSNPQTRLELLTSSVTSSGVLGFRYDESHTLTAAEAFEKHKGNCIGFSNMLVALARRAGLDARLTGLRSANAFSIPAIASLTDLSASFASFSRRFLAAA